MSTVIWKQASPRRVCSFTRQEWMLGGLSDVASNYRNGADLERAAKRHLEDNGYYVIKSGGSKGIVDLAAFKPMEVLFVQCKRDGYVAPAAREDLRALARGLGAIPIVARWAKVGTSARFVAFKQLYQLTQVAWEPDYGIADAHATARATERPAS